MTTLRANHRQTGAASSVNWRMCYPAVLLLSCMTAFVVMSNEAHRMDQPELVAPLASLELGRHPPMSCGKSASKDTRRSLLCRYAGEGITKAAASSEAGRLPPAHLPAIRRNQDMLTESWNSAGGSSRFD